MKGFSLVNFFLFYTLTRQILRSFKWNVLAPRAPLTKIKRILSKYLSLSTISHILTSLFWKNRSTGILLISLFLNIQFAVKISLVPAFNQKVQIFVLKKWQQTAAFWSSKKVENVGRSFPVRLVKKLSLQRVKFSQNR